MSFKKRFISLFIDPIFLGITLIGNSFVLIISFIFYKLEYGTNPMLDNFLDALWWGYATITTVGYGDVYPISKLGKILGIILMLAGSTLFATYTALFADFIFGNKILGIKSNIKEIEKEVEASEEEVLFVISKMQNELEKLEKIVSSKKSL